MSNLEKVDLYLGGNMSSDEVEAFEQDMKSNPELHHEVQLQDAVNHHLGEQQYAFGTEGNEYKRRLEEIASNEDSERIKETIGKVSEKYKLEYANKKSSRPLYYVFSVAAVVLLFFGSYFLLKQQSGNDLYNSYFSNSDLPSFVQRSNTTDDLRLEKATALYNEEKYDSVLIVLDDYHKEHPNNYLTRIYSGLSYANLEDKEKALKELTILENATSLDAHKAYWHKSLVYLKFEDKPNAKLMLQEIVKSSNNYKYNVAKEILEAL